MVRREVDVIYKHRRVSDWCDWKRFVSGYLGHEPPALTMPPPLPKKRIDAPDKGECGLAYSFVTSIMTLLW